MFSGTRPFAIGSMKATSAATAGQPGPASENASTKSTTAEESLGPAVLRVIHRPVVCRQ